VYWILSLNQFFFGISLGVVYFYKW
jgi:hypothetical protein